MINTLKNQEVGRIYIERRSAERRSAGANDDYSRAIAKIERLEAELTRAKRQLDDSLNSQNLMSESLGKCTEMLNLVENQLKSAEAAMSYANLSINASIDRLTEENKALKLSNDMWLKRSINFEFDLLTANNVINEIKAERDLALGKTKSPDDFK